MVAICFTFFFQLYMVPANANECRLLFVFQKISDAVGPLNRIKDILVAGSHPSQGIHGHARAS